MHDRASRELARQWDARDPLARFRKLFWRPASQIYLDGGSLGLCSQDAERALLRMLNDWKTKASERRSGGEAPWSALGERLAARVAALVGAAPDEVAIGSSAAWNLHQLLAALYRRQFHRPRILIDGWCAAADREVARSHLDLRSLAGESQLLVVPPDSSRLLDEGKLEAALADPTVQMAMLPMVVCATGQLLDTPRLCRAARRYGVIIGLDLSHSLGVIPHALDEWQADFAFWGHERYANAGPGAAAGLYLNRRHFEAASESGLAAIDAASLQIDPPPILSMAPLDGALRALEEAGLDRLRAKSLDLTHFLRTAIEGEIPRLSFVTPPERERRGGHLALLHPSAGVICQRLRQAGVSADFREPDLIYLAPSPLYNSFVECWDAVQILKRIVEENSREQTAKAGRELTESHPMNSQPRQRPEPQRATSG